MQYNFCTISTLSHLYKCFALFDSILEIDKSIILHILITDSNSIENLNQRSEKVVFHTLSEICTTNSLAKNIAYKYKRNADKLRWSMKPIFINYLLRENSKIIYTDNDIAFFGDFKFLFKELDASNILLTAHNYPRDPSSNQNWLEANFRVGLYNAGFIAVNKYAIESIDWWAKSCYYRCEKNYMRGLFDDQKYLDLIPIIEPKTKVLDHKGCNLAGWNLSICKRNLVNGDILINNKWPVIFIHFNPTTISCFVKNQDPLLYAYYEKYSNLLKRYKPNNILENEAFRNTIIDKIKLKLWKVLNKIN